MIEVIHRLRKQPEHKRRRVLVLSTLGAMAFVVLVWTVTLEYEFRDGKKQAAAEDNVQTESPFSTLKNTFSGMIKNAKQSASVIAPTEEDQNVFAPDSSPTPTVDESTPSSTSESGAVPLTPYNQSKEEKTNTTGN